MTVIKPEKRETNIRHDRLSFETQFALNQRPRKTAFKLSWKRDWKKPKIWVDTKERIGGDTILSAKGNCRRNPDPFITLGQIVFLSRYGRKRSKQASIKEPNLHRYRNKNQINQTNRAAHRSAQQIAEHYQKHPVRKKEKTKKAIAKR